MPSSSCFSRPLRRHTFTNGKNLALAMVWAVTVTGLFIVITATLLLVGNAPLQGTDYLRLGIPAVHTIGYLIMWSLPAMALAALTRRAGTGLILALVLWLMNKPSWPTSPATKPAGTSSGKPQ